MGATGRCEDHQRNRESPWRAFYRSPAWRALARIVKREEPICRCDGSCGKHEGPCTNETTDADHIVSITDGGARLERTNVQGLCERCHIAKTWQDRARRGAVEV